MVTPAVIDFTPQTATVHQEYDREYWRHYFAAQLLSQVDPQSVTSPAEVVSVAQHVQKIADATLLELETGR